MIKHIVFFNLADFAEGKSKTENALYIKSELENLMYVIPEIQYIEVGINADFAPTSNFDIALFSEFASMSDLDAYQVHPEHKRVASYIAKVKTDRVCVDYQV